MDLIKKLKTGASKAANVAQQTVEITKLTTQIAGKKRELEKHMSLLGHEVFEAYEAAKGSLSEESIQEHCRTIEGLKGEIAKLERQIKHIRNEKVCACGNSLAADANFCPDCGRPQLIVKAHVINIEAEPVDDPESDGNWWKKDR